MKRYMITSDELYPVYFVNEKTLASFSEGVIELSPAEYADFERVWDEWNAWQDRIEQHLNRRA